MIDFNRNHFELFELPVRFALERSELDTRYRQLQNEVHPDRFAHLPEHERRLSMQWATQVNGAYQTLKTPLSRAAYLLSLHAIDALGPTQTAMPAEFLMEQMEWREAIDEGRATGDVHTLESLSARLAKESAGLLELLHQEIDLEQDFTAAALTVRKLKFMEKLDEDIGNAIEALLG